MVGQTIAHYKVGEMIGAGGMGEVYQATDTKLNREVALKVLPEAFAKDAERMARFKREAQVLASLNHPNIAAIYGLEQEGDTQAIAMELVEGPTLADRIKEGALSLEEALNIAKQIADALESAHEQGIIHRDLKPANVKVREDGQVKVLDFGLAKALEAPMTESEIAHSPTLSIAATRAGIILGTAAYMSPEQARGEEADKRADIWSFGVVLFEMLTGQRLFTGRTASDVLAAVLRAEADWDSLPEETPQSIRKLLRRCLTRERKQRLQAVGDARFEIEEALTGATDMDAATSSGAAPSQPVWQRILPWALAGVMAVAGLSWQLSQSSPTAGKNIRFVVNLPMDLSLYSMGYSAANVAVSLDGTTMAFGAVGESGSQLYVKRMDSLQIEPLEGTQGGFKPFFSPDGQWVGFHSSSGLKKVSVAGGSAITLTDESNSGADWGADGTIVYGPRYNSGLWRVSDSGGTPEQLTTPDSSTGVLGHFLPDLLPNGRAVVFTKYSSPISSARVAVFDLRTGRIKDLVQDGVFGRYVPTGSSRGEPRGHLVFVRGNILMAVPFDAGNLAVTGDSFPVLEDVVLEATSGASIFSFSAEGTLAYVPRSVLDVDRMLVWVDREGNETPVTARRGRYSSPELSPDGTQIALARATEEGENIWLYEIRRDIFTRLTLGELAAHHPLWTPDGERVIYMEEHPQWDIHLTEAGGAGTEQVLVSNKFDKMPGAVTPDGKTVIYYESHPETGNDLWHIPLGDSGSAANKPVPLLQTRYSESEPKLSPDGRWLAYASNESGQQEIYVVAYPDPGDKTQVSAEGGSDPRWSRDGRRLFYRNGRKMMEVTIDYSTEFSPNAPRALFEGTYHSPFSHPGYSVARDGRFLMLRNPPGFEPRQIHVILNWFEEVRRLAPDRN